MGARGGPEFLLIAIAFLALKRRIRLQSETLVMPNVNDVARQLHEALRRVDHVDDTFMMKLHDTPQITFPMKPSSAVSHDEEVHVRTTRFFDFENVAEKIGLLAACRLVSLNFNHDLRMALPGNRQITLCRPSGDVCERDA